MDNEKFSSWLQVLKAAVVSTAIALVLALAFAGALRVTNISDKAIVPVNFVIKAVAVLTGCLLSLRGEKGWLRGAVVGILFICLSGTLFSFVGGGVEFSWLLGLEILFGAVAGALSGIFSVNIKGE